MKSSYSSSELNRMDSDERFDKQAKVLEKKDERRIILKKMYESIGTPNNQPLKRRESFRDNNINFNLIAKQPDNSPTFIDK